MNDEIKIIFQEDNVKININDKLNIIRPTNHNELMGLDYESSGHTGFASSKQVEELNNNVIPRRLSIFPKVENSNRRMCMIYVDDNGKDSQISMSDMLSKIIRTSNDIPQDLQVGEYLFLEKEND